jgi:antitoxin (DNA-binding transcriptional repressor) of toxin-antitoxin stability system
LIGQVGERRVSARDLARSTKELLDEVESGRTIVVIRYGRAAAALVPLRQDTWPGPSSGDTDPPPALDAEERTILKALAQGTPSAVICDVLQMSPAIVAHTLNRLELAGLIRLTATGYRLRPEGLAAVRGRGGDRSTHCA